MEVVESVALSCEVEAALVAHGGHHELRYGIGMLASGLCYGCHICGVVCHCLWCGSSLPVVWLVIVCCVGCRCQWCGVSLWVITSDTRHARVGPLGGWRGVSGARGWCVVGAGACHVGGVSSRVFSYSQLCFCYLLPRFRYLQPRSIIRRMSSAWLRALRKSCHWLRARTRLCVG